MKYNHTMLANDSRVFKINPEIPVQNVRFTNRFGFELAGHLYLPKDFDPEEQYPGIVITGPFGAVKEQASGLYAQTLAERGFVTLAFDQSSTGESSGTIRNMPSPDIFVDDISAGVDFLITQAFVNPDEIGVIGICGLGSHALTAASIDKRIKAIATSVMYDMSDSIWNGLNNTKTEEQRDLEKDYLADWRTKEALDQKEYTGPHELSFDSENHPEYSAKLFPNELPENADPVTRDFYNYYVGRAYHPRSVNSASAWNVLAPWSYYNFPLQQRIEKIEVPKLIVTGEIAHSRYMAEEAYNRLTEPKQIIIVPNATHVDLYDQMDKIPFDSIEAFFKKNLK